MSDKEISELKVEVARIHTQLEDIKARLNRAHGKDYWVRLILTLLAGAGLALGAGRVVSDGLASVGIRPPAPLSAAN